MGGHENVNAMGFPPSSNVSDLCNPFLGSSSTWDHPLASLSQAQSFGGSSVVSQSEFATPSYPVGLESQGISMSSTSQFVQYMSDSNYADMVPKVPSYGSCDIVNTGYVSNYYKIKEAGIERASINEAQTQSRGENSEEGATASASHGSRRKRGLDCNSMFNPNKSSEEEALKDSSEQDEKKPKSDQNTNADLRGKQSAKQAKDNSHSGEAPKQNFIHVRARRGQATNSHSLAERVRREKISERMRLLQELVPGCNKITGKAVMLDEIINYVQSLQQQVEFLSMKLATVNPELNFDVERILSKDILQSRIGHGTIGGYGAGIINTGHLFRSGSFQGTMGSTPSTSPHIPPLPQIPLLHMQNATDHELQSLYGNGMGYDSSTALQDMGANEL